MIHVRFLLVAVIIQDIGLLLDSNNSGEKYQTIKQISLSHLQIFAVRQRYLSEEAELVHGMETMQM